MGKPIVERGPFTKAIRERTCQEYVILSLSDPVYDPPIKSSVMFARGVMNDRTNSVINISLILDTLGWTVLYRRSRHLRITKG
jgi:hypothetical protein